MVPLVVVVRGPLAGIAAPRADNGWIRGDRRRCWPTRPVKPGRPGPATSAIRRVPSGRSARAIDPRRASSRAGASLPRGPRCGRRRHYRRPGPHRPARGGSLQRHQQRVLLRPPPAHPLSRSGPQCPLSRAVSNAATSRRRRGRGQRAQPPAPAAPPDGGCRATAAQGERPPTGGRSGARQRPARNGRAPGVDPQVAATSPRAVEHQMVRLCAARTGPKCNAAPVGEQQRRCWSGAAGVRRAPCPSEQVDARRRSNRAVRRNGRVAMPGRPEGGKSSARSRPAGRPAQQQVQQVGRGQRRRAPGGSAGGRPNRAWCRAGERRHVVVVASAGPAPVSTAAAAAVQ
jgi:hypothetical protein